MKKTNKLQRTVALLLLVAFSNLNLLPALAVDVTSGNVLNQVSGKYGADLNNATGAKVTTDYTNATVTNTQTNSVLNWNSLNTAPNQTLNFVMQDGYSSLNNVLGTMSEFAGRLTAEHGRLIISNPNGMLFENGSYTNANALILTTHNATLDLDTGKLTYGISSTNSKGIKLGNGDVSNAAVFRIADDLNIISNGIKIDGADILAGNNVRLITADGVNFVATSGATPTIETSTNKNALKNNDNNGLPLQFF